MRWLREHLERVDWEHLRTSGADVLGFALVLAAIALIASWTGCSAGPQTAGTGAATSPSCAWTFTAGGDTPIDGGATMQLCHDCTIERVEMSCLFDRTSSTPSTTQRGIEVDDVDVSPDVRTNVSATGGTGGSAP